MIRLSDEQIRWFRQRRSGLATPFATPEEAAGALGGVQAQILSAATLALWNRSASGAATASELSARLFDERSLIRLWGQRHTLHVYATGDWPFVHAAFAERCTWWEREAAKGSDIDLAAYRKGVARIAVLLKKRGTLSRRELRTSGIELPAALLSPWGGVFAELVRQGLACLARWEGGEARYAHRGFWLPGQVWSPVTARAAIADLARRYFECYGPATVGDLAYWLGFSASKIAPAIQDLSADLTEVETPAGGRRKLFALVRDVAEMSAEPLEPAAWPVRLLGRFDPLPLAHNDKDWVVPAAYYNRVWRPAGHIEGVLLDQGRAIANWRYDRVGAGKMNVRVFPFRARLPVRASKALRKEARAVARFFELQLGEIRVERFTPAALPDAAVEAPG